jgi:hypothetical protein
VSADQPRFRAKRATGKPAAAQPALIGYFPDWVSPIRRTGSRSRSHIGTMRSGRAFGSISRPMRCVYKPLNSSADHVPWYSCRSGGHRRMERRLAAIVRAGVAGYSRMMGADEAGTHAAFKAHRSAIYPIILNHGGRLVKNTGDGFLLEFPSIVGAIESAIAMQALMAEPPPRGSGHAVPHGHPHGRRDRRRRRSIRG